MDKQLTVKERPILFSGPMVRAILEGRKTQTRRVIKPQPSIDQKGNLLWKGSCYGQDPSGRPRFEDLRCPYGNPGDRLWVRETWRVSSSGRHYPTGKTNVYVEWRERSFSRGSERGRQHRSEWVCSDSEHDALMLTAYSKRAHTWRPSINMPRWASRILLEVTGVRVERLQEISEEDAIAEGVTFDGTYWRGGPHRIKGTPKCLPTAVEAYRDLWEHINGAGSWDANPWVWVVEFKRVESEVAR